MTSPGSNSKPTSLCLSGGGFRAALFHLGALRRLNETGILSTLNTITSVSGGSVISGHLANMLENSWPRPGESLDDWDEWIADPFRRFTSRDLSSAPILSRFWPWNWFRKYTTTRMLAKRYHNRLTRQKLGDTPSGVRFVFLATDMAFGTDFTFERHSMGNYQIGFIDSRSTPVADAMTASSAFPPSFDPLPLSISLTQIGKRGNASDETLKPLLNDYELTDGGIYDNLGLEPVWKQPGTLLVSDGGASFKIQEQYKFFKRIGRYLAVENRQKGMLRRRWLFDKFRDPAKNLDGAYFATYESCRKLDPEWSGPAYSDDLVAERIATIRTNMDKFTDAEQCVLENHGYLTAAASIARYTPQLISTEVPVTVPHPIWMDEDLVRRALARSAG